MFESAAPQDEGLNYTKNVMWEFFTNNKYEIFVPNRVAHNGLGLTMEGFSESHIYPRRTTNYLAVPIECRAEIRDLALKILNK